MTVIRDEEKRERERIKLLSDPYRAPDRQSAEKQFAFERIKAQQRIESIMKKHETQMKSINNSSDDDSVKRSYVSYVSTNGQISYGSPNGGAVPGAPGTYGQKVI